MTLCIIFCVLAARTAISGMLMRRGWQIAVDEMRQRILNPESSAAPPQITG